MRARSVTFAPSLPRKRRLAAPRWPSLPLAQAGSLAGFVLLWWLGAHLAAAPQLLPSPATVLATFWEELRGGDLLRDLSATLFRVIIAFAVSIAGGAVLGYAAGRSRRFDQLMDPWLIIFLNLPVLVAIILVYIWVGLNEAAAILAVTIAKTPTVIVTVREGSRALDPRLEDLARVFRLPTARRLRRIVLPQLAPYLAAAARSGLSITWKIVLIVELLGRPNGVGFALNLFFQSFNVAAILAYGLSFAAIMLVIETVLLQPLERRANAWRRPA